MNTKSALILGTSIFLAACVIAIGIASAPARAVDRRFERCAVLAAELVSTDQPGAERERAGALLACVSNSR